MQWQVYNTYELIVCFLIGMILFASALFFIEKIPSKTVSSLAMMALSFISLSSFFIHLCRQLGITSSLIQMSNMKIYGHSMLLLISILFLIIIILMLFSFKGLIGKIILSIILIISPVTLVIAMTLVQYGFKDTLIDISLKENSGRTESLPDIYIIIFDELDYDFLYEDKVIESELENFSSFSKSSTNYHNATAPGDSTLPSMSGLLLGNRDKDIVVCHDKLCEKNIEDEKRELDFSENNIFKKAKSLGYETAIYGWVHEYCQQYAIYLNSCRTYSTYNYATINNKFSLIDPILTNIILWPHQFPFGLLKIPVYSQYQKQMVNGTLNHLISNIDNTESSFVVAHFSIPHIPFVFDEEGFNPPPDPFLQNRENYIKQLIYTDKLFGEIINKLKNTSKYDSSIIMVSSDHGYRKLLKREDWNKVPLLIRFEKNGKAANVNTNVMTEEILFDLFHDENRS